MMYVMSVQEEVFLKTDVTVSITLWIVLKNVVVQLHQMYVESVMAMVSQKVIAIVKVKNLIVHSNVVETLLSMDVESVTDQVLSNQCVTVTAVSGIVKIHQYAVLITSLITVVYVMDQVCLLMIVIAKVTNTIVTSSVEVML